MITANLIIAIITILISLIPLIFLPGFVSDPYAINFFGALSSTFVAIIFLFYVVTRRNYSPHSKFKTSLADLNWNKQRTPYIFGLLAGFPPCIFELLIYSQCLVYSLSYGWVAGFFVVFYFALGTFIGLFPLALAKQTAENIIPKEGKDTQNNNTIFIAMLSIVIVLNIIIMILSFLRIHIFPI